MGSTAFILSKYLITAALVVVISEVAKHLPRLGALIAALPTVTILVLVWMYLEDQPAQRLADHAWFTFWYALPTLPMFVVFPFLLDRFGFWGALGFSTGLTVMCFVGLALVLRGFGVELI
ncbi:MAG: DUF3147 family protein [Pseudohongiellaceae bacterium]